MLKWLVIFAISGFFIYHAWADVIITELSGTNNAEFGTSHSLECSYNYENETGVEIKWFYNGDNQIFLWIPNRTKPNAMDMWKAVLDTNDTSPDHDVKHSVIHFKELNFNMSGDYTCKVTGDEHEDAKTERMIVYQPASFVAFDIVSENNNTVTLSCSIFEVYPKPTINITGLYLTDKNGTVFIYLKNESIEGDQSALYNVTTTYTFNTDELTSSSVEFSCIAGIAETNYSVTKSLQYTKSGYETTTTDNYELVNDTTISTETEISTKTSLLDNSKKQGGIAAFMHTPRIWDLILALAVVLIAK